MANMTDCATTLILAPGVSQVYYGDETGRGLSDARFNVDSNQAFRSDMDWNDVDTALTAHFARLGKIRNSHPAIGKGRQTTVDTHTCYREYGHDRLMIRLCPVEGVPVAVAPYFADGDSLVELYTGQTATVRQGKVLFPAYKNKVAVIAPVR